MMTILFLCLTLFVSFHLSSCTILGEVQLRDNAEEVIRNRSNGHVVGYQTYYMGSDQQYDNYRTNRLM